MVGPNLLNTLPCHWAHKQAQQIHVAIFLLVHLSPALVSISSMKFNQMTHTLLYWFVERGWVIMIIFWWFYSQGLNLNLPCLAQSLFLHPPSAQDPPLDHSSRKPDQNLKINKFV